ncbi:MAG: arginine repressor [Alkalispirochaetaceae bacterium]
MKERSSRLKAIKRIIRTHKINSQETLLGFLREEGFHLTQATLSRDLKLLKVGKQSEGTNGYFYTLPSEEERREAERNYVLDFQRGYVSLECSGNVAVVRTLNGHADSVAIALDNMGIGEILGTVAGNDTVIVVVRQGVSRKEFVETLRERVPDFEE